jgi:hypothetical protein
MRVDEGMWEGSMAHAQMACDWWKGETHAFNQSQFQIKQEVSMLKKGRWT